MRSVYLYTPDFLLVGGNGVFKREPGGWVDTGVNLNGGIWRVRGKNTNNIFAVGSFGVVHHYNGVDWRFYNEVYSPAGGTFVGVCVAGSKVFIVGTSEFSSKVKILIGNNY